jgi:hypothetical protein
MVRLALILVILAFGALSAYALMDVGYFGIFAYHMLSSAGWQVLTDLIIVCTLAIFWMVSDAKKTGRNAWPYVVITLAAGSFGPLFYLLVGEFKAKA